MIAPEMPEITPMLAEHLSSFSPVLEAAMESVQQGMQLPTTEEEDVRGMGGDDREVTQHSAEVAEAIEQLRRMKGEDSKRSPLDERLDNMKQVLLSSSDACL